MLEAASGRICGARADVKTMKVYAMRCLLNEAQIGDRPIRTRTDVFAQHLANGLSVVEAAREMSIYSGDANGMMQRIRRSLGLKRCV
jgi:hypothetical protein